jgi:hypothetical protein
MFLPNLSSFLWGSGYLAQFPQGVPWLAFLEVFVLFEAFGRHL